MLLGKGIDTAEVQLFPLVLASLLLSLSPLEAYCEGGLAGKRVLRRWGMGSSAGGERVDVPVDKAPHAFFLHRFSVLPCTAAS